MVRVQVGPDASSSPADEAGVPSRVAPLDRCRLVVRTLGPAAPTSSLAPQGGAGARRRPQRAAVVAVGGRQLLVLQVQHGQGDVEVLRLGRDVLK